MGHRQPHIRQGAPRRRSPPLDAASSHCLRRDSRLQYCSSDFWSGNAPGSADTPLGLNFMGSVIVQSVIQDLVATQGLGSEAGARLLFSGCSAGAIGAMNNLERVIALVPPTVQVQGFLDGAALLDIYPAGWSWSDMLVPLQELMANLTLFANPVFPPYCAQLFGADTVRRLQRSGAASLTLSRRWACSVISGSV